MSDLTPAGTDDGWYSEFKTEEVFIPLEHLGDDEYRGVIVEEWSDRMMITIKDDYSDRYTNDNKFKDGVWTQTKEDKTNIQGDRVYAGAETRRRIFIEDLVEKHSELLSEFNIPHDEKITIIESPQNGDRWGKTVYRVFGTKNLVGRAELYTGKEVEEEGTVIKYVSLGKDNDISQDF